MFNDRLQAWEDYYNFERPHGGLDGQTPYERLKQKTRQPSCQPPTSAAQLAITEQQAQRLPSHPSKTTRRVPFAVEAEAMPAEELTALLHDALSALVPHGYFDTLEAIEAEERQAIRERIRQGALVA